MKLDKSINNNVHAMVERPLGATIMLKLRSPRILFENNLLIDFRANGVRRLLKSLRLWVCYPIFLKHIVRKHLRKESSSLPSSSSSLPLCKEWMTGASFCCCCGWSWCRGCWLWAALTRSISQQLQVNINLHLGWQILALEADVNFYSHKHTHFVS